MSYAGQTYKISCADIGYNASANFDAIPPNSMVSPSKNVEIHNGGVGKRGGSAHVNSTAVTSTPDINGLYDFRLLDNTQIIIGGTGNGKIYSAITGTPVERATGITADSYFDFITYNNDVYITNYKSTTADIPKKWDGSATLVTSLGLPTPCTAALAGAGAGNVNAGTHSYKITFTTASGETSGSNKSNIVTTTAGDGQVALTNIQIGPTGTTSRKVYRTDAGDASDWKLIGTIANNTATTFADNVADGAGAAVPTSNTAATLPSDWTGNAYPRQFIVHGYGNSERMWAFGVPGKQNWIYVSPNNDGSSDAEFSQANILTLYIEPSDGFGLVGGVEFQDRLIAFGKRKAFIIDDSDLNTDNWGYVEAAWDGGAASHKLIIKTPNDLICFMEDGEIYSVTAAQQYGDYKLASISRPHYMHTWIKNNLDLTKIDQFHGRYDRKLRAVRFWVVRNNQTVCDTQIIYYIDTNKWAIEDNETYASGCKAACSAEVRAAVGDYNIYTGDYDGFIWKLNQTTKSDNNNGYWSGFRLPHLSFESGDEVGLSRFDKMFRSGRFIGDASGDYDINVTSIVDGGDSSTTTVNLSGTGGTLGSFVLGTDTVGGGEFIDKDFSIGMSGKRLALELSNSVAGQDFFISALSIDFKTLGSLA